MYGAQRGQDGRRAAFGPGSGQGSAPSTAAARRGQGRGSPAPRDFHAAAVPEGGSCALCCAQSVQTAGELCSIWARSGIGAVYCSGQAPGIPEGKPCTLQPARRAAAAPCAALRAARTPEGRVRSRGRRRLLQRPGRSRGPGSTAPGNLHAAAGPVLSRILAGCPDWRATPPPCTVLCVSGTARGPRSILIPVRDRSRLLQQPGRGQAPGSPAPGGLHAAADPKLPRILAGCPAMRAAALPCALRSERPGWPGSCVRS